LLSSLDAVATSKPSQPVWSVWLVLAEIPTAIGCTRAAEFPISSLVERRLFLNEGGLAGCAASSAAIKPGCLWIHSTDIFFRSESPMTSRALRN